MKSAIEDSLMTSLDDGEKTAKRKKRDELRKRFKLTSLADLEKHLAEIIEAVRCSDGSVPSVVDLADQLRAITIETGELAREIKANEREEKWQVKEWETWLRPGIAICRILLEGGSLKAAAGKVGLSVMDADSAFHMVVGIIARRYEVNRPSISYSSRYTLAYKFRHLRPAEKEKWARSLDNYEERRVSAASSSAHI